MGSAMANNLANAGHSLTLFDVDDSRTARFAARAQIAGSPADVAAASDVVLLSLPSVSALEAVVADVTAADIRGTVFVEMGTLPLVAKEAARDAIESAGATLLDVPVSGTGLQAADATLVIFASGDLSAVSLAEPVFEAIGRSTHYLGEFGNGSKMKYIANLLVAVHNLVTAEAHALGLAAGLDPQVVQDVMSDGIGASKIWDVRGPMMVADDYPAAARLSIILKDARIIKEFADAYGAPTPLLDAAIPLYEQGEELGLGDLDAAALCRALESIGGIARR
jgi:3-hydroxyisobutyrate dehydrogenase-like beta-hydroxyacid dehydrogenase